ncbi:MAG: NADH-quinone oxidoreductase subunit J [Bacteroidetes bacterium]|jgi:NADH-quinone oxidoreductase subunit J|nr:NADH-quinone oxidoreductase subunit J [Bacteroidota bacterium]
MTFEQGVFYFLAGITVFSAVMMLLQRNPVNSALYLILNFFCLGGLYLTLNAQFIAMVHILVYAGAIMVLFLFVIMLLNLGDDKRLVEHMGIRMYFGIAFSVGLLVELLYIFGFSSPSTVSQLSPASVEMGTVEYIGKVLFTKFLFPFEITSFLLLAAIIGAVLLAKKKLVQ